MSIKIRCILKLPHALKLVLILKEMSESEFINIKV